MKKKIINGPVRLLQDWVIGHPVLKRAQKTNLIEFSLPFCICMKMNFHTCININKGVDKKLSGWLETPRYTKDL